MSLPSENLNAAGKRGSAHHMLVIRGWVWQSYREALWREHLLSDSASKRKSHILERRFRNFLSRILRKLIYKKLNILFGTYFSEITILGKEMAKTPGFITHHLQQRPLSSWKNAKWRKEADAFWLGGLGPCPPLPWRIRRLWHKTQDWNLALSIYSGIYVKWAGNSSDQDGGEDV